MAVTAPSVFARRGFLGVLTLDTNFPRLVGDIGNPASFGVPALTRMVRGAKPELVVQSASGQRDAQLLAPFADAMHELEARRHPAGHCRSLRATAAFPRPAGEGSDRPS